MSSESPELAIDVRRLTKRFGQTVAADDLNLTVHRGRTFGLLGPNGAGKSTLIRMLMGLTEPDQGTAFLLGHNVEDKSADLRQRIGFVPELHFIYRWMTVREVLQFVSALYRRWDDGLAEHLLSKFELPLAKRVSALSKGMIAKLGLLVALAHHPELLILDEPTSGLDPIIREDFVESILQNHGSTERTILFSSHHVDDVERVADDVGLLIEGKLVLQGPVDDLRIRVKRIQLVLKDGRLPVDVPDETVMQRLNRREWTLTVYPFSTDLLERVQRMNDARVVAVLDLNLEEIFKDFVRGSKARVKEPVR